MGKGRMVLIAGVLGLYAADPAAAAQSGGMNPAAEIALVAACLQKEGETALPEGILSVPVDGEAVTDTDTEQGQSGIERMPDEDLPLPAVPDSDIQSEEPVTDGAEEMAEQDPYPACQEPAVENTGGMESEGLDLQLSGEDIPAGGTVGNEVESQPSTDKEEADADSESDTEAEAETKTVSEAEEGIADSAEDQPAEVLAKEGTVSTASTGSPVIETDIEIETIAPAFPAKPSGSAGRDTASSPTEPGADGTAGNSGNSGSGLDRDGRNATTFSPSRSVDTIGNVYQNSERKTSQAGLDRLPKTGGPLGKKALLILGLILVSAGVSLNWVSRRKRPVR